MGNFFYLLMDEKFEIDCQSSYISYNKHLEKNYWFENWIFKNYFLKIYWSQTDNTRVSVCS